MTDNLAEAQWRPGSYPRLQDVAFQEDRTTRRFLSPAAEPTRLQSPMTDHSHTSYTQRTTAAYPSTVVPLGSLAAPVKKKRVRAKTERRRHQCRMNQARYRTKQNRHAVGLENSVAQLRQEIWQLEAQRHSLTLRMNTSNPATRVAMEYCRLFSRGLASGDRQPPRRSNLPTHEQQVQFVRSTFHYNARIGFSYGWDQLIKQAGYFTSFYGGLHLTPEGYTVVSSPHPFAAVKANGLLEVTITESTIRHVYPHLLLHKYDLITRKLVGLRVQCSTSMEFVFDEHGVVVAVDWSIDFVSAFLRVLDVDEIVVVLQQELVVRDTYLIATDDHCEDAATAVDLEEEKSRVPSSHRYDEERIKAAGKRDGYIMV